jgi:hypothetical protein
LVQAAGAETGSEGLSFTVVVGRDRKADIRQF